MTTQAAHCPRCGDAFPDGLEPREFEGICPSCLAFLAVEKYADGVPNASSEDPLKLAAKDPPPLKRGGTFHGMEILELIGQGGMGVVYKARQIELNRLVALKILSPRLAADPEFPRRFNREAQALASLDHSNIVRIHDVGREGDLYFIVMEYVDGMTLRDLLVQKKLPPEQTLRVVPQLCDALEYAHSRGVIHRDIKPENIILSRSGVAKIADFGLAKIVKDENAEPSITQTNVVMGTADYMAPEQRDKTKAADHRADIYSLGVVLYELLTGELPVGRFDPPTRRRQVDARLDDVVLRALEKDPDRRYQRASHMGRDVEHIMTSSTATPVECSVVDLGTGRRIGASPGLRIAVRAVACPLSVRGWEKPDIGLQIDGDYQFDGQASTPLLQAHADTRSITLFVPRGIELDASVDERNADLCDIVGHVIVKIPDGALRVDRHDGVLRIHAGQGKVKIHGLKSEYFEVRTRSGSVDLADLELSRGRGQVETEAGEVSIAAGDSSSFRFYFDTRSGIIAGPASGQVGAGTGWLTVRTGAGNILMETTRLLPLGLQAFLRKTLTPPQLEKLGKYVIVNIGLFLFFIFVSGTAIPAIMIAIFWGISLGLEIWKGYVRRNHASGWSFMEKVFKYVPTPLPDAPAAPPRARPSLLATLAVMTSLAALLSAAGSAITMMVEGAAPGLPLSQADLDGIRLGAFASAAAAFFLAIPGCLMGMAASSHVRESSGFLKGRGAAHVAVFFSILSIALALGYVKPRLERLNREARESGVAAQLFVRELRDRRFSAAHSLLSENLKASLTEAELQGRVEKSIEHHPDRWKELRYHRTSLLAGGSGARVEWLVPRMPNDTPAGELVLERQGTWRVTDLKSFLERLGD
jgi:hypothetical protein